MKRWFIYTAVGILMGLYMYGCAPKYGCPANGKSVGAERILSGEKTPKTKAFKN
ncbi:MAG: hypothetical protein M9904_15000 [Chitinophagaceae bacterium]|nr:hypothetical protein [Chitinophagaceae bacterium]